MKAMLPLLFLLTPLAVQDPAPKADDPIVVGKPAVAFRLNDDEGKATAIGGASKTWTALAFYPKAATGG